MTAPFTDRADAGRALAARLTDQAGDTTVVLGLPRGGVVVAAEVAAVLKAPLDLVVVRKLGVPWQPELAMGAIAAVDTDIRTVRHDMVLRRAGIDEDSFQRVRELEIEELRRREAAYRQGRPPIPLAGKRVLVVDDGLATGSTMRAALSAVRRQEPDRLIVAVPVASPRACEEAAADADDVVCLWAPQSFSAVGQGYVHFDATTDEEVREALARSRAAQSP